MAPFLGSGLFIFLQTLPGAVSEGQAGAGRRGLSCSSVAEDAFGGILEPGAAECGRAHVKGHVAQRLPLPLHQLRHI